MAPGYLLLIVLVVVASGVLYLSVANQPPEEMPSEEMIWVQMDPVQCLGNPWEQDWIAAHPGEGFPQEREAEIITAFYDQQDIRIIAVRIEQTHEIVCAACSCPRGDTVFLQVSTDDADVVAWHGFGPEGKENGQEVPEVNIVLEGQEVSLSCITDADCQLINSDHDVQCCWEGACDIIDYSQENWIAVNRQSYQAAQWNTCPLAEECGPAPACAVPPGIGGFEPQCVDNVCRKDALQG